MAASRSTSSTTVPAPTQEANWLPAPGGPVLPRHAALLAEAGGARRAMEGAAARRDERHGAGVQPPPFPCTPDNFVRAESDLYFAKHRQGRAARQAAPSPRAGGDRQPDRHPPQSRHALFRGRVRSRRRPGDDHAAGRRQALHVDAGDRRGPIYADVFYGAGDSHADQRGDRHALRRCRRADAGRSQRPEGPRGGPRAAGRDQGRTARRPGKFEIPHWDQASQKAVRDASARPRSDLARHQGHVRPQGARSIRCAA